MIDLLPKSAPRAQPGNREMCASYVLPSTDVYAWILAEPGGETEGPAKMDILDVRAQRERTVWMRNTRFCKLGQIASASISLSFRPPEGREEMGKTEKMGKTEEMEKTEAMEAP